MQPSRSTRGLALPATALLIALGAILVLVAAGVLGRSNDDPGAEPTNPPIATPTAPPSDSPTPTPTPTPEPTDPPTSGNFEVDLDIVDEHDVSVIVDDQTDTIVDVKSGRAGDGMSVRWYEAEVVNLDEDTLRLTWVGLPVDAEVGLLVMNDANGVLRLVLVQPEPPAYSDAIGFDRVLVIDFDQPVDAAEVIASTQDGLDTVA